MTPDGGPVPELYDLVPPDQVPDTIDGWKAVSDGFLANQCCAFHRNAAISSRYVWMFTLDPARFKWAAMAAIVSHHVRLVLYPLRFLADGSGYVDVPRRPVHRRPLLTGDVNTIRSTNNAIYEDIFWAHLAYVTPDGGIERLRALMGPEPHYAAMLAGFESIEEGCRGIEAAGESDQLRRAATDHIWAGNLQLLEHEQRFVVQPNFDHLSCPFARLISLGSATAFEVHGMRQEAAYFTSFYGYAFTKGVRQTLQSRGLPRITCFEDRWRWLAMGVVPRFRKLDANMHLVDASLRHIYAVSHQYASMPCIAPVAKT